MNRNAFRFFGLAFTAAAVIRPRYSWRKATRPGTRPTRPAVRGLALLRIEPLEGRDLPAGFWIPLANPAPDAIGTMTLLSDGTVMAQDASPVNPAARNRWYRLTPTSSGTYSGGTWSNLAAMNLQRLNYASNVLPDSRVLVLGGEYSGPAGSQNWTNTGEIYNPVTNSWTAMANFPQAQFGDAPTQLLPDGRVLAGYRDQPATYIYNPATNAWTPAANKLRNDPSAGETWTKLPDDSILSYDISAEAGGTGHAQRYVPTANMWADAGNVPTTLSGGSAFGNELGGAVRLPDGRIWFVGANSHTAFYTPSTNTWVAGPNIPNNAAGQLQGADDGPMAVLPTGNVLLAVDNPLHHGPTNLYEYSPVTNTFLYETPSVSGLDLSGPCATDRMLVLPDGTVLFTAGGNHLAVYFPQGGVNSSWRPIVNGISRNGDTFTLTGTQLNGISQGASYGDDAEMDTNYPIVRVSDYRASTIVYARTFNWSITGVATGNTPESVHFTMPSVFSPGGVYLMGVVANGIDSGTVVNVQMDSSSRYLTILNKPGDSSRVQILYGDTVQAEFQLSQIASIAVTGDAKPDYVFVSYQYGNPLPAGGLSFGAGTGDAHFEVDDLTNTSNQTFTLTERSVQRSGSAPITFSGTLNRLDVVAGRGNNTFNINGTVPNCVTEMFSGQTSGTFNVRATSVDSELWIRDPGGPSGSKLVTVGNAGSLAEIRGRVTIEADSHYTAVTIDDSVDPANHPNVALISDPVGGLAGLGGLAPADIVFRLASPKFTYLTINGGSGNNTYTISDPSKLWLGVVLNTGSGTDTVNAFVVGYPLAINGQGGGGNDVVNLGVSNSLAGITGPVSLTNPSSSFRVNVKDSADSANHPNVVLTNSSLTGLTPAVISWTSGQVNALVVNGGSGVVTYNVEGTTAGTAVTLNTGTGDDVINLSPVAHNLANLAGLLAVNGQGASDTLNAFDQATTFLDSDPSPADDLYRDRLARVDPTERTVFTYQGMKRVNVSAGRGDGKYEGFFILGAPAGVPVTVANAGAGASYVEFIVGAPVLDDIQGPVTVHGRAGTLDLLELFDTANPNAQTFTVTATTITRSGMAPVSYDQQTQMNLFTSNQSLATVNVQSTAANVQTQILLEREGDQAILAATGIQDSCRIFSGGAVTVTVDDVADTAARTAVFAADPSYRYLLTGLAPGRIFLDLDPGSSMQVLGGSGGNTFKVQGLMVGTTLALDGGSGVNTLQGADSALAWQLDGHNSGNFSGGVSFTAMQNLVGGAAANVFRFGDGDAIDGTLNAGPGSGNTLDYSGYASTVVVNLRTGLATGVSAITGGVAKIYGGTGNGASGAYNILIGNGIGNSTVTLVGGSGRRNLLIAGAGQGTLYGGDDQDILIGGMTSYDLEAGLATLNAVMADWANTAEDYATRVANAQAVLYGGAGGTVVGNGNGNTLLGGGAPALFYGNSLLDTANNNPDSDTFVEV